jgi:hypothetical protein
MKPSTPKSMALRTLANMTPPGDGDRETGGPGAGATSTAGANVTARV